MLILNADAFDAGSIFRHNKTERCNEREKEKNICRRQFCEHRCSPNWLRMKKYVHLVNSKRYSHAIVPIQKIYENNNNNSHSMLSKWIQLRESIFLSLPDAMTINKQVQCLCAMHQNIDTEMRLIVSEMLISLFIICCVCCVAKTLKWPRWSLHKLIA